MQDVRRVSIMVFFVPNRVRFKVTAFPRSGIHLQQCPLLMMSWMSLSEKLLSPWIEEIMHFHHLPSRPFPLLHNESEWRLRWWVMQLQHHIDNTSRRFVWQVTVYAIDHYFEIRRKRVFRHLGFAGSWLNSGIYYSITISRYISLIY